MVERSTGRLKGADYRIPMNLVVFGQAQNDEDRLDHETVAGDMAVVSHPVAGTASMDTNVQYVCVSTDVM